MPGDQTFARRTLSYMIRSTRTGSSGFVKEIGQAVWSVNPNLPLASVRTLQEVYDTSLARTSFTLVMLAIAGGMALLLGIAGIYGVISYSVSQRTREIGIRMALGARGEEVMRMFVGYGFRLARYRRGLRPSRGHRADPAHVLAAVRRRPSDPLTLGAVSVGLIVAALLASYLPAARATSVNPVDALRAE